LPPPKTLPIIPQLSHPLHRIGVGKILSSSPPHLTPLVWAGHAFARWGVANRTGRLVDLQKGNINALVTAPIHKAAIQSEDFRFPGHTDYLAQAFDGDALMFLVHPDLRVALVTDHVAVKDIARHITTDRVAQKLNAVAHSLQQDFGIPNPRIAVLGLNPHAGDEGVIGEEEVNLLEPMLQTHQIDKTEISGPFSADAFFGSQSYKNYDAILAMYHDQGLIPFKTLSFGQGVNFTAGLSAVRTSPDHGTAFGIAGTGQANLQSFRQAVQTAIEVVKRRNIST